VGDHIPGYYMGPLLTFFLLAVATVGTTSSGAVDNLAEIKEVGRSPMFQLYLCNSKELTTSSGSAGLS
jgi:glutamate/tyrosine decarboxylase-like PLP-dependent enzyme